MGLLLLEALSSEAHGWLAERHPVDFRPELAEDPLALRPALYKTLGLVLGRKTLLTRELLDFAPKLRAIARLHSGTDNTDLEACRERGIKVIQPSLAHVRSNAEYLLGCLLMMHRRGVGSALLGRRHAEPRLGRELQGSVVGILGLGPVAHSLAPMLRALDVKLIGYDPAVHAAAPIWDNLGVRPVGVAEMVSSADSVAVTMMYASRYQGFVNAKLLAHCKPGQCWAGVSRSSLFDPQALAEALGDGRIEACLLDSAEAGFASKGSPLHQRDNLYLTPRLGSYTRESRLRASWYVAHRIHEAVTAPLKAAEPASPSRAGELELPADGAGLAEPQFIIR